MSDPEGIDRPESDSEPGPEARLGPPGADGPGPAPDEPGPTPELPQGTRLGNHEVRAVLGRGGMGVIYDAEDSQLGRDVAIKVLPASQATNPRVIERFLQEARAAARLRHPNVVTIYEIGRRDGLVYLVMEPLRGGSLADAIARGPVPWPEATEAVVQACNGLAAAHARGLIHRDIKPSNLLRGDDGTLKITDFGLAKLADGLGPSLTQAGRVVGTPAFMSPEQCQAEPLDARTDLYSLGASYYAMLTGLEPYADSGSGPKTMFAHCYKPVPDPRAVVPGLPPECASIVRRAMAKAPRDRYPDADALRRALDSLLAAHRAGLRTDPALRPIARPDPRDESPPPAVTPPPPSSERTDWNGRGAGPPRRRGPTRRDWLVASGAAGALAAAGGGAWLAVGRRPGPALGRRPGPAPPEGPPIRVGVLHSTSGFMSGNESNVIDGTLLAVEELNASGGVLGRPVDPVVADGRSDPDTFAAEAGRLIEEEGVAALFGCWTSASRKAVRPVVERLDHLLFYPLRYEGLERSPNIVYLGAAPNQQLLPAVKWAYTELGHRFFLVGNDYVFPRAAAEVMGDQIEALGGTIVEPEFVPMNTTDFAGVVRRIEAERPDVILNVLHGDGNAAFFRDLRDAGIASDAMPTVCFSVGEPEVRQLDLDAMAGDYAAATYFMSIDLPENRTFIDRFRARFGPQKVTSDPIESAFVGVHLWALAAEAAGSARPPAVRSALPGMRLDTPCGPVEVDPENNNLWKTARLGRLGADGQFEVVFSSPRPERPEPFPKSRSPEQWQAMLDGLHEEWGGRWAAPA